MNKTKLSSQKNSSLPCKAKDIFEINSSKEYTLISSNLLNRVLTDSVLNAGAAKLWQILFNKSRFDKNLEVKISYPRLAEIMGKSVRTIQRYTATLEVFGYLLVESTFAPNKAQGVNTFMVRFPKHIIEETKQQKDRQRSLSEKEVNEIVEDTSSITQQNIEEPSKENKPETLRDTISKGDKTVRGGGDKDDTQYNIISEDININNNNRSSSAENESTLTSVVNNSKNLEKEDVALDALEKSIAKQEVVVQQCRENRDRVNKQWINTMKSAYSASTMQNIQTVYALVDTKYIREKTKLDTLKQKHDRQRKKALKIGKIETNTTYMLKKQGSRPISTLTFNRLISSLKKLNYTPKQCAILTNEVIFAARFGSLVKSKDNKTLTVDHGINIGIKLIREGRWTTPAKFEASVC